MRVSAGFLVMDLCGNALIHNFPEPRNLRATTTREASSWRAGINPFSRAFKPNSPKCIWAPVVATPRDFPFCVLRYLTLFGINSIDQPFLFIASTDEDATCE